MIINQTYTGGGIELSLVISVASGSVVTATKGGKSVTGVSVDGVCVLTVPEAGTWTVSATLNGKTTPTQTVTVKSQWEAALEYPRPLGELAIGSSVFTEVGGVRTEFLVVHHGKPSSLYSDTCDGTWVLMKDVYLSRTFGSASYYPGSDTYVYLNTTFPTLLSSAVAAAVKRVKIPVGADDNNYVRSGENGADAIAFLLSCYELGWYYGDGEIGGYYVQEDGAALNYFAGCENAKRIALYNGAAMSWFTRTPRYSNVGNIFIVQTDGSRSSSLYGGSDSGVRPAFILPSDVEIQPDGTISA